MNSVSRDYFDMDDQLSPTSSYDDDDDNYPDNGNDDDDKVPSTENIKSH